VLKKQKKKQHTRGEDITVTKINQARDTHTTFYCHETKRREKK
jgi:hypothetical protein